ncbi:MAG: (2Fe-2S)-binding protein [Leptospirales bacterium]|nr:(2Fe-2S)-binding protein [Leptospirales bacterium]
MADEKLVKIKVNERDLEVPAGWSVIRACHENQISVPHYCYHQDLSVAGNCRMCLVKVKNLPKPVIACGTPVVEGMEIDTISDEVVKARSSVMEFLLINHPLDCPECDQAGECRLQDYSYTYGRDHGRFQEKKVVRRKASLGPHVKYWGSRCIVCTRCVRFTNEISGGHELTVANRGDRSEIQVFPGKSLDNPLSMNVVDVCPVGALVSADFLYQQRVWYLNRKPSLCAECSVGCNTRVDSDRAGQVKRIVPRRNDAVNKEWMCDHGRLSFEYLSRNRLAEPLIRGASTQGSEAIELGASLLAAAHRPLILLSSFCTNEAIAEGKALASALRQGRVAYFARAEGADQSFPGFFISGDRNPNRAGLEKVLGAGSAIENISASESFDVVLIASCTPELQPSAAMARITGTAEKLVVIDFASSSLSEGPNAAVVLPGLSHFEKSGSFTNRQGIEQSFAPAVQGPTEALPEAEWLQRLRIRIEKGAPVGA